MREAGIVNAVHTPFGNFNGTLSGLSAVESGAIVIEAAVKRAGISKTDEVPEVIKAHQIA